MTARLYVTMTDRFFSGWGKADGLINKFIVECDTYEQAAAIEAAAVARPEMKYINIRRTKPCYGAGYLESWRTAAELPAWLVNGGYTAWAADGLDCPAWLQKKGA